MIPTWIGARNLHLLETFGVFLLIQLVFAKFYFWLYRRRRENFSFNDDILDKQKETTRALCESKLTRYKAVLIAFHQLQDELQRGATPISRKERERYLRLSTGYQFVMTFIQGERGIDPGTGLRLTDPEGNVLLDHGVEISETGPHKHYWYETPQQWQAVAASQIADYESLEQTEKTRLDSLLTPTPDVWSYWDFLYFSTIVQTTVGFGDILPNSTSVRMLVSLHVVIGYVLLVVVLNIVLGSSP